MKGSTPIVSSKVPLTSLKLSKQIALIASDMKAEDIVVLEMKKLVNFCDYFVLASAQSDRQVKAIAEAIEEELEKKGIKARLNKGMKDFSWVVVDLGDVVTHVFKNDLREFYNLEYLWQDAKVIKWE